MHEQNNATDLIENLPPLIPGDDPMSSFLVVLFQVVMFQFAVHFEQHRRILPRGVPKGELAKDQQRHEDQYGDLSVRGCEGEGECGDEGEGESVSECNEQGRGRGWVMKG